MPSTERTHTFADCAADNVLRGTTEYTRRYIALYWPHGEASELADTHDAATLSHAFARLRYSPRDGYFPGLEIVRVMDSVQGDYSRIREWADNFRTTGVLWAGDVVGCAESAQPTKKPRARAEKGN
jgi:hypothetical protein